MSCRGSCFRSTSPISNLGWSLIILAVLIRLLFWPLNTAQFKAFLSMQKIAPQLKKLQTRYKADKEKLQQETMALYREYKVNPLAGCWPMLVQYPVIISVYYVVMNHKALFENQTWAVDRQRVFAEHSGAVDLRRTDPRGESRRIPTSSSSCSMRFRCT